MSGSVNSTNRRAISTNIDEALELNGQDINDVGNLQINNDVLVDGNVVIGGDATVNGDFIAVNTTALNVSDNRIYLNNGYVVAAFRDGSIVINRGTNGVTANQATVTGGAFTAGNGGAPTVILDSATSVFSAGHIIQVSGSVFNDGIFEVFSQPDATLSIRGVGGTSTVETWTQNQFIAETATVVSIVRINVTVLKSNVTTGLFEEGLGNQTGITYAGFTTTPAGIDTQIQFNDGGSAFGADAELTYNKTSNVLSVTNLSVVDPILLPLRSFSVTNNTATLGFASLYACTDTTAVRTLTLSNVDIAKGTSTKPWFFDVKDESGGAGTNNITVDTEGAQTIDDASSLVIEVDFGVLRLYSNGTDLFTR